MTTYYLSVDLINTVDAIREEQGHIKAIQYLRRALSPLMLIPLRDTKRIVDCLKNDTTVTYTRGTQPTYRIFKDV